MRAIAEGETTRDIYKHNLSKMSDKEIREEYYRLISAIRNFSKEEYKYHSEKLLTLVKNEMQKRMITAPTLEVK